ncbi:hypothetical protein Tco_0987873, partial [Tanacetum coccineum]
RLEVTLPYVTSPSSSIPVSPIVNHIVLSYGATSSVPLMNLTTPLGGSDWATHELLVICEFTPSQEYVEILHFLYSCFGFLLVGIVILLGLKRLHGFLEVTASQVYNGNYAKCAAGGKIACLKTIHCQEDKDVRNQSRFGINKWYQSLALRNFDLEDMELESTNSGPTAKLPILKLGEYEMWAIRIKQYFQIQDYAL